EKVLSAGSGTAGEVLDRLREAVAGLGRVLPDIGPGRMDVLAEPLAASLTTLRAAAISCAAQVRALGKEASDDAERLAACPPARPGGHTPRCVICGSPRGGFGGGGGPTRPPAGGGWGGPAPPWTSGSARRPCGSPRWPWAGCWPSACSGAGPWCSRRRRSR